MAKQKIERGMFICLEGGDGSGKSTQAEKLTNFFKARGLKVETLQNPGTTPLGLALRQILLSKTIPASQEELVLLFTAARSALAEKIRGLVEEGTHVVVDRWLISTMVYQGILGGVAPDVIAYLHKDYVALDPDLYVVLDVPPEVARTRLDADRPTGDRFTDEGMEGLEKLRQAYLEAAGKLKVPVVNGFKAPETVHRDIMTLIMDQGMSMLPDRLRAPTHEDA